jgi:hypothetical protein
MPNWGADLSGIDFDNIKYFVRSTERQATTWEDLPDDIKNRAAPIFDDVRQALTHDSHVGLTSLNDVLTTAYQRLLDVAMPQTPPPPPPPPPPGPKPITGPAPVATKVPAEGREERLSPERATDRIAEIRKTHPTAEIEVSISWKPKGT